MHSDNPQVDKNNPVNYRTPEWDQMELAIAAERRSAYPHNMDILETPDALIEDTFAVEAMKKFMAPKEQPKLPGTLGS